MRTLRDIRADRAKILENQRKLHEAAAADGRDFTAEEQASWAALEAEDTRLREEQRAAQAIEDRARALSDRQREAEERDRLIGRDRQPGSDQIPEDQMAGIHTRAMRAWCRSQYQLPLGAQDREALEASGISPASRELEISLDRRSYGSVRREYRQGRITQQRAQSPTTGSLGGFLVPQGFGPSIESAMLQFSGMRQAANVFRTDSGNELPWPTVNDTSNKGALIGANVTVSPTDLTFGQIVFRAHKFTSNLILVPVELLEDSAFDLPNFIGGAAGTRIGRNQNDYFTTGTGSTQPYGVVTAATLGKTAAGAAAITYGELIELKHSVDPAYRSGPGVAWMMSDSVFGYLKRLLDANNRPILQSLLVGVSAGQPEAIDGDPVIINTSMAALATTNKTVLYGDFSKYMIRDVANVRMRRLVERYADADQEGFVVFARSDGNLLDAGTRPIKYLQQA